MSLRVKFVFWLLLASLLIQPVNAQRRPAAKRPPAEPPPQQQTVSFDTLLAADTYKIYGEVRSVGQLIRSDGVKDLIDPVLKLAAPPKEFKALVRFLNTRADALLTSRLLFAAWPSKPKLPQALVAIEFASPEEAQKFEPQLREFLPKLLPTPTPGASPAPGPASTPETKAPAAPPYVLKQVGQLVFITDAPFALKDLKPKGSKLLAEDQSFRMAHERLATDSVFLYVDMASIQKEEEKRTAEYDKQIADVTQARAELEQKTPDEAPPPPEVAPPEADATPDDTSSSTSFEVKEIPKQQDSIEPALSMIAGSFFNGRGKWPDGIGASLVFDGDSYVLRVLIVNASTEKISAIPFFPHLISGPPVASEAPSVLPADTELFVSASLDLPQIHETMNRESKTLYDQMQRVNAINSAGAQPLSPFDAIEKRLGIKLKDEVLPLLGNEIALTIPMSVIDGGPTEAKAEVSLSGTVEGQKNEDQKQEQQKQADQGPSIVVAISIKDREGIKALLPKIIDSVGFKGASMLAQTEKHDDTELVTYANAFAYALVGNFLVLSPDIKATRHVVDSYLKHETLSANTNFRNYTRWQPRQVLGQIYLSPALMESYNSFGKDAGSPINEQLRDFLMMVSPVPQPVTYALANEGQGPLHELHVPKNLVMMIAASVSADSNQPETLRNEGVTQSAMRAIASAETTFQATEGAGRFGSLEELTKAGLISKEMTQNFGYKVELAVSGTRYEVTAVPTEYGKTGKLSFFVDESGVLRAGDHAGAPATISDKALP